MAKPESDLQKKCVKYLKDKDIYYINKYGDGRSGLGAPDLLTCIHGRFVAFELKVGNNERSNAQDIHKIRIERNGGRHYTPYTLEEFIECVEMEVNENE